MHRQPFRSNKGCAPDGYSQHILIPLKSRSFLSRLLKPALCTLIIVLFGTSCVVAAEIDDSNLFIEAFGAYQKKDYLLTLEKIGTINQLFPDTPLRDVTLLLQARAALKSGDNELAAKSVIQFNNEFAANPLKTAIEDELERLVIRRQKGEKLLPTISLRSAAQKVRNEQLALERAAAERIAQERLRREQAEQERIALEKAAAERRERERLAREKALQDAIKAAINLGGETPTVGVGQVGTIPFEVANLGPADENFVLEASAPPEYETVLTAAGKSAEKLSRVTVATTLPFKGTLGFRMPANKVDGQKSRITLRVISEKYHHLVQTREAQIIAAAPLVRVVAKPEKQKLAPGEQTRYRVTVLNAGTLAAKEMTVRLLLPAQLEFLGGDGMPFLREASGAIIYKLDTLETGQLAEFMINVKVRDDSPQGRELRSTVEVALDRLQLKQTFSSAAVVVQK